MCQTSIWKHCYAYNKLSAYVYAFLTWCLILLQIYIYCKTPTKPLKVVALKALRTLDYTSTKI